MDHLSCSVSLSQNGQYGFPEQRFSAVSNSAKDLIRRMLTINPLARYSASEVMHHPWMRIPLPRGTVGVATAAGEAKQTASVKGVDNDDEDRYGRARVIVSHHNANNNIAAATVAVNPTMISPRERLRILEAAQPQERGETETAAEAVDISDSASSKGSNNNSKDNANKQEYNDSSSGDHHQRSSEEDQSNSGQSKTNNHTSKPSLMLEEEV